MKYSKTILFLILSLSIDANTRCMNDNQKIKRAFSLYHANVKNISQRSFSFYIKSEKPASPTTDHLLKKNLDSELLQKAIQEKNNSAILAIIRHAKKKDENNNWYTEILKKFSTSDILYLKAIESNIDKK